MPIPTSDAVSATATTADHPNGTSSSKPSSRPPLHAVLPPLVLGTATFNTQYVSDPLTMPSQRIVARAIELGVNCFDTSPYYGPSEILLGNALASLLNPVPSASDPTRTPLPRSAYTLITKAGRVAGDEFDYSPAYVRYSVLRSLQRLHTPYLDLVYTHDVEFVSDGEVLAAVRELRRLRDEDGLVRYVGISGYPVRRLCELAEMILRETGEGLDAVLSYGHFTVQNRALGAPEVDGLFDSPDSPIARFRAAGVDTVLNASMLGMGLLTTPGIPVDPEELVDVQVEVSVEGKVAQKNKEENRHGTNGEGKENGDKVVTAKRPSPLAKWHPSPPPLRLACKKLAGIASAAGERLEAVAIRWSLEEWARIGALGGLGVDVRLPTTGEVTSVGGSVMGVSSVAELEETVREWAGVLEGLEPVQRCGTSLPAPPTSAGTNKRVYKTARQEKVSELVRGQMWPALGEWEDYSWASPGPGFRNSRRDEDRGVVPLEDGVMAGYEEAKRRARLAVETTS